eukprot:TRINITY_DN192_c0_g1_i2.p1 TRINITY_DN192_c0_g1~~TRINITY_DN192_c0_g1_i2.p1  ORF type:complete len:174 (-),score=40.35 TRINITY_DN192_c0_g1_i2:220-741(-)
MDRSLSLPKSPVLTASLSAASLASMVFMARLKTADNPHEVLRESGLDVFDYEQDLDAPDHHVGGGAAAIEQVDVSVRCHETLHEVEYVMEGLQADLQRFVQDADMQSAKQVEREIAQLRKEMESLKSNMKKWEDLQAGIVKLKAEAGASDKALTDQISLLQAQADAIGAALGH